MYTLISSRIQKIILLCAVAAPLITACGGGDAAPTPPPVVAGSMSVAVTPAAVTVIAGSAGASAATITRVGSFTGDAALTAEGAPAGATVTFGTATLGAGVTSSTIAVATAATVTPGAYPITIKASGTGVTTASTTLTLTVNAAAAQTVAIAVAPASATVVAGAGSSSTATITRGGGFAGAVAVSATGAPTGMTVTFTPASIAAGATTSAIAVATTATVVPGTYTLVISAAGTGVTNATTSLAITVTAPVAGSSVTLSYCAADAPVWVAYQDGTGPWTRVTATGSNTYTFSISSGKAGVASVDTVGTGYDLNVTYGTTADFNGFGSTLALGACGTKSVSGTVANVSNTQFANVTLGYSTKFVIPITSSAFTLTNVASGPQDLFASRLTAATQRVDRIILRRALDIANGGSLAALDFNAAEAFAPATANVTVSGLGADTATIASLFNGQRGSTFGIVGTFSDYLAASGAVAYDAVPGAQLASGELQQLYAFADAAGSSTSQRIAGVYFRAPTNLTIAMGPALGAPTVTRDAAGPYSRARVVLAQQTEYNRFFTANFSQTTANRSASITATGGYVGSAAWDVTIPDLTGATGWTNTWGLLNGTGIDWSVSVLGGAIHQLDASIADGTVFRSGLRSSATPLP